MYPFVVYIAHATACLIFSLMLLLYKPTGSLTDERYHSIQIAFGFLCFMQVPVDSLFAWLYINDIDPEFLYQYLVPILCVASVLITFFIFSLLIHIPQSMMRWQYASFVTLLILALTHPVGYVINSRLMNIPYSIESYMEFCQTPLFYAMLCVLYVFAAGFIFICLYNIMMIRIFLQRMFTASNVRKKTNSTYVVLALLIVALMFSRLFLEHSYYKSEIVWMVIYFIGVMYTFNQRDLYIRMDRESRRLQFEMKGFFSDIVERSRLFGRKPLIKGIKEHQKREIQIIERTLKYWSNRPDKPYMKDNITISDVSREIGISVPILMHYSQIVFGCNFDEYITMLREKTGK